MARILEDRVLESTTSTGTGVITLAGAVTGFRRFNAVCAISDTVPYFIEALDTLGVPSGDYEYGIGTYTAANQITRTTVQGSSNGGSAVNFTAGTKNVGLTITKSELASQIATAVAAAVATLTASITAAVPAGKVEFFSGTVAPAGYVVGEGALLSRVTYPALWAYAQASGNIAASDGARTEGQYSPGDGVTTFRTPDYRGRFFRAADVGRGIDAGRVIGSSQTDLERGISTSSWSNTTTPSGAPSDPGFMVVSVTPMARTGGAETRPANIAVLACIKT